MLADVVGATSTAAVSFSDAKTATETLSAVAVNKNVRTAAILRNGAVFARFDRTFRTTAHIDPDPRGARPRSARLALSSPSNATRCGSCVRSCSTAS